jgi:hypothetical protein
VTDHKGPAIRTRPRWQVWHVVMITILVCFTIVMFRLANTAPDATAPNTQAASSKEAVAGPVDKGTAASACMDAITPMLAQRGQLTSTRLQIRPSIPTECEPASR